MKLTPVDSSMIRAAGYDPASHTLEVLFASGRTYVYQDVPRSRYKGLMAAESKGRYMNDYIIDLYAWHEVRGGRKAAWTIEKEPHKEAAPVDTKAAGRFAEHYPNITLWVLEYGSVEIGFNPMIGCFVLAIEEGEATFEGKSSYESLDEALADLERGIANLIKEIG